MEKSGWMATRQTSQTPTSANNGTCALYSILNTHFMPPAKAKRLAARLLGRLPGQPAAMIGHRVDPTIAAIFDAYWYSRHAPKLAEGEDPLRHYLSSDPAEQSDPHPLFHGRWYLRNNPDVAASGLNPLAHYVNYGAKEGRAPCAYFDGAWYSATYLGASPRPIRCCISSSTAPRLAISPTHTSIRSGTSSITRKQERPTLTR